MVHAASGGGDTAPFQKEDKDAALVKDKIKEDARNPFDEDANGDADGEADAELEELLASVKTQPTVSEPRKITHLPAFLFDGATAPVSLERNDSSGDESALWDRIMPQAVAEIPYSSAAEEIARLVGGHFKNAFEVFKLPAYAKEEDVRKAYRKLSLVIHPDKCGHELASEAFNIITQALDEMARPETRKEFRGVIEQARKNVMAQRRKENRERKRQRQELLPENEEDLIDELRAECQHLVNKIAEDIAYADRVKKANAERERAMEAEMLAAEAKEKEAKRLLAATRMDRVENWKAYVNDIRERRVKPRNFVPVAPHRETQLNGADDAALSMQNVRLRR